MAKAAMWLACFLLLCIFVHSELLAQSNTPANNQVMFINRMESVPLLPFKSSSNDIRHVLKTCEFKTIRSQYSQLFKVKPDSEMVRLPMAQLLMAERETQNKRKLKQNEIIRIVQMQTEKFNLASLTFDDLQSVTPSTSGNPSPDIFVHQAETISIVSSQQNPTSGYSKNAFSNAVASAEEVHAPESTSVSLRRSSGLLKNKSALEQKYILAYKLRENESE